MAEETAFMEVVTKKAWTLSQRGRERDALEDLRYRVV